MLNKLDSPPPKVMQNDFSLKEIERLEQMIASPSPETNS
jgi:hypothetical protein